MKAKDLRTVERLLAKHKDFRDDLRRLRARTTHTFDVYQQVDKTNYNGGSSFVCKINPESPAFAVLHKMCETIIWQQMASCEAELTGLGVELETQEDNSALRSENKEA